MTHTATTTTFTSTATAMGSGNRKSTLNSFSANDLHKHSLKFTNNKDVAKWTSSEVHHWVKQQCKMFELKKATVEKFEMNGQALVLLTKHDFLRRSPDGGEILYYALQRLINPNKLNSARLDQTSARNGLSGQHPRIVEVTNDNDGLNSSIDASSTVPIVEQPDDPPAIRRSHSETYDNDHPFQQHPHPFFFNRPQFRPAVFTMPAGAAAAYFHQQQQQQGFPNGFAHTHHPQPHIPQPHAFYPHLMHQYHPMMSARGILIEIMDDAEIISYHANAANNPINGTSFAVGEQLYMVTINGQRYVMNEAQVRQLVTEVYQHQQNQQLQQQQYFQQQQQQQQQHFRSQQLRF